MLSATDAVAATALLRDIGAPRRLVALLESESLFKDATALVAYQAALGAAVTASFSATEAGARILVTDVGGIVVGLAVGLAIVWLRRQLHDAPVEITISLLTPLETMARKRQSRSTGSSVPSERRRDARSCRKPSLR